MQDPRLRLLSVAVLSLAAFASTVGAAAALVWWLLFTPRTGSLPRPGVLLPLVGMVAATALVSAWGGGAGLSYFFRMTVILLLAAWAYTETEDGEVLAVAVWALGNRVGFEVGLVAEMGISGISVLRQEIEQQGCEPGLAERFRDEFVARAVAA